MQLLLEQTSPLNMTTPNQTPTPETDALCVIDNSRFIYGVVQHRNTVPASFARSLERRLAAEIARAEKWKRVAGLLNVASLCDCTQDGGIGCDACQTALASYAEAMKE